ncbi:MAG: HEPN domain-containing protein [Bacteroidetes bacterium]|nr:HEPN domain-containing protein [Bacteroidota bacterium]
MKNEYTEWISKAEEDLVACKALMNIETPPFSIICYHAQQVAEKYIKAYLTFRETEIRKTHDIILLLDEYCIPIDNEFNNIKDDAFILSDYSVNTRYPGDYFPLNHNDANEALDAASKIKSFIIDKIS